MMIILVMLTCMTMCIVHDVPDDANPKLRTIKRIKHRFFDFQFIFILNNQNVLGKDDEQTGEVQNV